MKCIIISYVYGEERGGDRMHYKGHIITKEIPSEENLKNILEKYYYKDGKDKDKFEYDYYIVGGRYGGRIKINFDVDKTEERCFMFQNRNYKYFISNCLDKMKKYIPYFEELDYLRYMGLIDDVLYVDGGYYNDTIDFDITECFTVIDDDENLYVREYWNGNDWIENEHFDDDVRQIDLTNKFITIIDFHD